MSSNIEKYGVKAVKRPKIKPKKSLNLEGQEGEQIILSETKLVMRTHKNTFRRLADM